MRLRVWQPHGTVARYRQGGCADVLNKRGFGEPGGPGPRCDACKRAMSDVNRAVRAGLSPSTGTVSSVTSIVDRRRKSSRPAKDAAAADRVPGPVELGVLDQLAEFESDKPAEVAMAIAAAQIVDDPERVTLHPTTIRQLHAIVTSVCAERKKKSRGRLAAVQAMCRPTTDTSVCESG